jgi:hypothetical protein
MIASEKRILYFSDGLKKRSKNFFEPLYVL